MNSNELILYESQDKTVILPVQLQDDTVWLNRNQMAELFDRDVKTIGKHIGNALREELDGEVVVAKFATTTHVEAVVLLVGITPDAYVRIKMEMKDFDLTKSKPRLHMRKSKPTFRISMA